MQNNFRGRMYRTYILNAPWTFSTVWSVIKAFMEESTASKIIITSNKTDPAMESHINPAQFEEKYGGKLANLTKYWPPELVSPQYQVASNPTKLLSPEAYQAKVKSGELQGCKISPANSQ